MLCITNFNLGGIEKRTMEKILFATLSVAKENKRDEVKIYKIKSEKFGIQIESNIDSKIVVNTAENITSSEDKINKLLDTIVMSSENFTLLDDFAYDFADTALSV